jgi:membrane protein
VEHPGVDVLTTAARRLGRQVLDDDVMGLAAELAYRFFLALFPFAIFVAGVGAFIARQLDVQNPATVVTEQLAGTLPSEAAGLIEQELRRVIEQQNAGLISFGVLAAVFFATGGTNAVIKALNRAFDVDETRPFLRRYLLALGLTVLAGASLILAFALIVLGQVLAGDVASRFGLGGEMWDLMTALRWPVVVVLLVVAVTVLYRLGPNLRMPLRWVLPGAAIFTVGWLAATWAFGFYVSNFASYGATYGALAGVAILLIWFYLSSFLLLLGAEINDVIAEVREADEVDRRRQDAERQAPPEERSAVRGDLRRARELRRRRLEGGRRRAA